VHFSTKLAYLNKLFAFGNMEQSKKISIAYWVITALFCLHYAAGGVYDAIAPQEVRDATLALGYPVYFIIALGILKVLAAIVLLVPQLARFREWAYAGITFNLAFASYSHWMSGDAAWVALIPLIILAFALSSYFLWHKKK
jgi:uncharacterized membrane protein YphA (DoxX/SURF4 family)